MKKQDFDVDDIASTPGIPRIVSVDTVAIYDPSDGRVVHLHQVVRFEGAPLIEAQEQKRNALSSAKSLGCKTEGTATLQLANFKAPAGRCRVDLKRKTLVELPVPPTFPIERPRPRWLR